MQTKKWSSGPSRCVPIDGSEDNGIHIQGLDDYAVEEDDMDYTDVDLFSDEEECD